MAKSLSHRLLPHHFTQGLRPPLAVENLGTHTPLLYTRTAQPPKEISGPDCSFCTLSPDEIRAQGLGFFASPRMTGGVAKQSFRGKWLRSYRFLRTDTAAISSKNHTTTGFSRWDSIEEMSRNRPQLLTYQTWSTRCSEVLLIGLPLGPVACPGQLPHFALICLEHKNDCQDDTGDHNNDA